MFHRLFLSLALLLFTLTACEFQEPVESITVQAGRGNPNCDPEIRSFDLISEALGSGNYMVTLETGPFEVGPCMCRLLNYKLYVTLNSSWNLSIAPSNVAVGYLQELSGTEDVLTIYDLELIYKNIGNPGNGKLYATSGNENFVLDHAGGLCVIENFDGSGPINGSVSFPIGSTANAPIVQISPGPLPDSYVVNVYIPVGITNPI